ncbi:MAG: hypothetical protein SGARI_002825 [Bacillariaceae sp.]
MAALLWKGDLEGARHLWRRSSEQHNQSSSPLVQDWWKVCHGMLHNDPNEIWQGLKKIAEQHPSPINGYATLVATSYRIRLLQDTDLTLAAVSPLSHLLGFSGGKDELQQFCQQHGITGGGAAAAIPPGFVDSKASLIRVLTFLETAKMIDDNVLNGSAASSKNTSSSFPKNNNNNPETSIDLSM